MRWNHTALRWPRPGLALRRHPRAWWAVVACVALGAGALAASFTAQAEEMRARWGELVPVVVAIEPVVTGELLDGVRVAVEDRPRATVPGRALTEVPDGARAAHPLTPGQVLTEDSLAGAGLSAVAARLPAGTRAVAVPAEPGLTPPLSVSDRVDVVVALPAEASGSEPPGFVLAAGALVVDVSDTAVTVAVAAPDAPRVAVALGAGAVTLALVGDIG